MGGLMKEPIIKKLESGYTHIRWNANCWAQIPPQFCESVIPDEYIFNPNWTRDKINRWWRMGKQ